jgi:cytochrome c553
MPAERPPAWRRLLSSFALFLALGVLAAALFIWSGIYPVGADRDHLGFTTWLLERVRWQSVDTWSSGIETPPLDDPDLARLGAAHFEGGCVPCHGRPGERIDAIAAGMLPSPPPLAQAMTARDEARKTFWIIKHGFKYTGMPAWPAPIRDDEVWALTAFLGRLRASGPGEMPSYPELAGIDRLRNAPSAGDASPEEPLTQCRRCHDDAGLPTLASLVPSLAGQSEPYLRRTLREYSERSRPSGIMQPVADILSDTAIERLAAHYARLRPASPPAAGAVDAQAAARGRQLARFGDVERDIPPCLACHGEARSPSFPTLAGQNADYLVSQLELWRRGGRISTTHGAVMAPIASRLTEEQMRDAAAYFSQQARGPLRDAASAPGP